MLLPVYTSAFARDLKRAIKRGKDPQKITAVIQLLCEQAPLPPTLKDHPLKGSYTGFRDCHIEPDLILIYRIEANQLQLICAHLGSHSDLFK